MTVLALVTGIGCVLVGGVFFAFSTFVMAGLRRLPDETATAAMRGINTTAVGPGLMLALFGTAAACAVLGVPAVRSGDGATVAGCAVYLVGVVGVTMVGNVPLNDRLAAGRLMFAGYDRPWSRWNHVRTLSGLASGTLLLVG